MYLMAEVIPVINVPTFEEAKARIAKVAPFLHPVRSKMTMSSADSQANRTSNGTGWVHVDVTDGVFSKHPTWRNPEDLPRFDQSLAVELHLMVVEPEKGIEQWLVSPVRRIIVHIETLPDVNLLIEKCHSAGVEIGLAVGPGAMWESLVPWCGKVDPVRSQTPEASADSQANRTSNGVDMVQVLAVAPGPSGQEVVPDTYDKIRHIREACPECIIEVDGGMNPETARRAREAGADLIASGAYIFNSPDIQRAIKELCTDLSSVRFVPN